MGVVEFMVVGCSMVGCDIELGILEEDCVFCGCRLWVMGEGGKEFLVIVRVYLLYECKDWLLYR